MFDGNGNWTSDFSAQADRDNGIKILASRFDNIFIADIKESFENCLTKDGQIAPIGDFNMGGQKITNVGTGTNGTDGVNVNQLESALYTVTYIGDIKQSVRSANHGNWFLCNGQAISRTTYADLFTLIGTNFGAGDGVTTFNLPDYRGKFLRGLGGNSAANIYTTQAEGIPNHRHKLFQGDGDNVDITTTSFVSKRRNTGQEYRYELGQKTSGDEPTYGLSSLANGSSLYGASAHVTPINQAIYYFIRVK